MFSPKLQVGAGILGVALSAVLFSATIKDIRGGPSGPLAQLTGPLSLGAAGIVLALSVWYTLSALALVFATRQSHRLTLHLLARLGTPAVRRIATATLAGTLAFGTAPAMANSQLHDPAGVDLSWGVDVSALPDSHTSPAEPHPAPATEITTAPPSTAQGLVTTSEPANTTKHTYTVRTGDSLWSIAHTHYGGTPTETANAVVQIGAINTLTNPHLIYPGQEIVLPER